LPVVVLAMLFTVAPTLLHVTRELIKRRKQIKTKD
jgi:hypothetical protein